ARRRASALGRMALSDDQTALLRLLLAGGTYEQVAGVLGSSSAEVKDRAHAAADRLEAETSADFSPEAVKARLAALEGAPVMPGPATPSGLRRRWQLWVVGAGALAVMLVVVLVVAGGGGGGGDQAGSSPLPDREDVVPVRMTPVGNTR